MGINEGRKEEKEGLREGKTEKKEEDEWMENRK